MFTFKGQLKEGELTACAPLSVIEEVAKLGIWEGEGVLDIQQRVRCYFQDLDRWEYVVTDDKGTTQAVLVIYYNDYDIHKGQPVLCATMAYSKEPGLLTGGYKWMYQLAKEKKIKWINIARTEGNMILQEYRKVK